MGAHCSSYLTYLVAITSLLSSVVGRGRTPLIVGGGAFGFAYLITSSPVPRLSDPTCSEFAKSDYEAINSYFWSTSRYHLTSRISISTNLPFSDREMPTCAIV